MDLITSEIQRNVTSIREKISWSAKLSGRTAEEIQLIAVSKKQPIEKINAAFQAGVINFGENYPEEAVEKILSISNPDIVWHMIGHLQRRKSSLVVSNFQYFQALDNIKLAEKLNKLLVDRQSTLPVLLEVNVGDEAGKFGWRMEAGGGWKLFFNDIELLQNYSHLRICGLMTMPPYTEDPEENRSNFRQLRILQCDLQKKFTEINWSELSMGTSLDFEVAIEEGATMIRIGQAIFGERSK